MAFEVRAGTCGMLSCLDDGDLPRGMRVTRPGLIMRKRFETSSNVLCKLEKGDTVTVHDLLSDGKTKRARILVETGKHKGTEGWVTHTSTKGFVSLVDPPTGIAAYTATTIPTEMLEVARAAFSVFDLDGDGSLSLEELKMVLTRPGDNAITPEEAQDLIRIFDANGDGQLQFEEFALMWTTRAEYAPRPAATPPSSDGSPTRSASTSSISPSLSSPTDTQSMKKLASLASRSFAKRVRSVRFQYSFKKSKALALLGIGSRKARSVLDEAAATGAKVAAATGARVLKKSKSSKAEYKPGSSVLTSMTLKAMCKELELRIGHVEGMIANMRTLPSVIGTTLNESGMTVEDLVREWDVLGSGEISRVMFRQAMRNPKLAIPSDMQAISIIDSLFDALDEDKGGTLDLQEMNTAFKHFQASAADEQGHVAHIKATSSRRGVTA
mmetsp:Transcript_26684/g.67871  ORF Transcript_26684/g.67871 Transcript_26684/m.67871 type:complete len:440 (-) Transcript_26684:944-2263(-)